MADLVNNLIRELQSNNSQYVLKSTTLTDGSHKGSVFIELLSKTGFRFLDLHSEIREAIYRLVLVKPDPICLAIFRCTPVRVVTGTGFNNATLHPGKVWDTQNLKWAGDRPNELSLLGVNKQIHGETTPIAYGQNRFVQGSSTAFVYFTSLIGSSVNFLTAVDLGEDCTWNNMRRLFAALYPATGLRKLRLNHQMVIYSHNAYYGNSCPSHCAETLAKDLKVLLLCLQVAYKAQNRTWKALDLVQIGPDYTAALHDHELILQRRDDARKIRAHVRKLANIYLKEE